MSPEFLERLAHLAEHLELLPDKPEEGPESTLLALWALAFGSPMSAERATSWTPNELDRSQLDFLDHLIERRVAGEPLGHLTGRQSFMGLELIVNGSALLPRQETEILTRCAVDALDRVVIGKGEAFVVDTCCGCGNVALAMAHAQPAVRVLGIDLSEDAIDLATANARELGLSDRVEFRTGDLLAPLEDLATPIDMITCNPPYISSSRLEQLHDEIRREPDLAFDGGPFGITILSRLIREAAPFLDSGAVLAFEVGRGQGPAMAKRVGKTDRWTDCESFVDADGEIRALRTTRR